MKPRPRPVSHALKWLGGLAARLDRLLGNMAPPDPEVKIVVTKPFHRIPGYTRKPLSRRDIHREMSAGTNTAEYNRHIETVRRILGDGPFGVPPSMRESQS